MIFLSVIKIPLVDLILLAVYLLTLPIGDQVKQLVTIIAGDERVLLVQPVLVITLPLSNLLLLISGWDNLFYACF